MKRVLFVFMTVLIISGCATSVKRVETGTQPELSGYWNSNDVRIVCESLVSECLSSPRVDQAIRAVSGKPMVIVGGFRNESDEQLNTEIIAITMETAIFNSGRLDFVAGGATRDAIRSERQSQQSYASEETAARLGIETGANFMMTGSVMTIVDREGNRTVRTYYVTAELTNIETNERMWIGQNTEITKVITRPNSRL